MFFFNEFMTLFIIQLIKHTFTIVIIILIALNQILLRNHGSTQFNQNCRLSSFNKLIEHRLNSRELYREQQRVFHQMKLRIRSFIRVRQELLVVILHL